MGSGPTQGVVDSGQLNAEVDQYKQVIAELEAERDHYRRALDEAAATSAPVESPDDDVAVSQVAAERDQHRQAFLNLQAEFDEFRKRVAVSRASEVTEASVEGHFGANAESKSPIEQAIAAATAAQEGSEADKIQSERDEYLEALRRLQAEFENFRKRTARERASEGARAARGLLEDLLPVVDNLGLAAQTLANEEVEQATGVEMVLGQLNGVLGSQQVEVIDAPEGEAFDPELHEAVQAMPTDEHPEGSVMAVVQRGYRFSDGTLLRPARVVVASSPLVHDDALGE
jgi:molecular chaperone GrpE